MKRRWNVNKFGAEYLTIIGPEGALGPQGPRGPAGPAGKDGQTGPAGPAGPKGTDGEKGDRGEIGPRGEVGAKGDPGKSGIEDTCRWLPKLVLKDFREETETCCFLLTNPTTDIKRKDGKAIVEWISRSDYKKNAKATHPSTAMETFKDGSAALVFKETLYNVDGVCLARANKDYVCLCATFKVAGDGDDQFIVSDWEDDTPDYIRGISASKTEIRIYGAVNGELNYISIQHDTAKWTSVLIEWTTMDANRGTFNINNGETTGVFVCAKNPVMLPYAVYIGGKSDETQYFIGEISSIEWYTHSKAVARLPDPLKRLIMENQLKVE